MPVAHALLQASEDLQIAASLSQEELWANPGNAAPAGFHLKHIAGSIDRLLSYAQGKQLTQTQLAFLKNETQADAAAEKLIASARAAIENALEVLRSTPQGVLLNLEAWAGKVCPAA